MKIGTNIHQGSSEIHLRRLSGVYEQVRPHINIGHLPKPLRCLRRPLRVRDHSRRLGGPASEGATPAKRYILYPPPPIKVLEPRPKPRLGIVGFRTISVAR
jgi:hypothetical protein